jgi:hypothetical protein
MLTQKPHLKLVRAQHFADEQIISAVVAKFLLRGVPAFNFWHAGGGSFEFRGARRFLRKLLRAFYI